MESRSNNRLFPDPIKTHSIGCRSLSPLRCPSGDQAGTPNTDLSANTRRLGFSPFAPITQSSASIPSARTNAICDPSRETEAHRTSSISLRGAPPKIEICQRPADVFGPSTQVTARWVPSGYHDTGAALNPCGRLTGWVSPVSIWRK